MDWGQREVVFSLFLLKYSPAVFFSDAIMLGAGTLGIFQRPVQTIHLKPLLKQKAIFLMLQAFELPWQEGEFYLKLRPSLVL